MPIRKYEKASRRVSRRTIALKTKTWALAARMAPERMAASQNGMAAPPPVARADAVDRDAGHTGAENSEPDLRRPTKRHAGEH